MKLITLLVVFALLPSAGEDSVIPGGRHAELGASSAIYNSMTNRVMADTPILRTAQAGPRSRG
jgi:hypothetical protein